MTRFAKQGPILDSYPDVPEFGAGNR